MGTNANGTSSYSPEVLNFNPASAFSNAATPPPTATTYGDGVFTTTAPDQVVVVFGDGFGGLIDGNGNFNGAASATVNLKVPGVINPVVTFGDFNGDGRVDIAVASGDPHNFSGVYVFFNQIGTALDPINAKNYTHSPVGDHPFSAAHQTALPTLAQQGLLPDFRRGRRAGGGRLQRRRDHRHRLRPERDGGGDFRAVPDGPGAAGQQPSPIRTPGCRCTTRRRAGWSAAACSTPTRPPRGRPRSCSTSSSCHGTDQLVATSLATGNLPDATTGLPGTPEVFPCSRATSATVSLAITPCRSTFPGPGGARGDRGFVFGQVDTNRNLGPMNISLVDFTLQQFTVQDVNGDGSADIVALSKTPVNFLVDLQGDGTGIFTLQSGAGDNAGIILGTNITSIALAATDTNAAGSAYAGVFDTVGVLTLPGTPGPFIEDVLLRDASGAPSFYTNNGAPFFGNVYTLPSAAAGHDRAGVGRVLHHRADLRDADKFRHRESPPDHGLRRALAGKHGLPVYGPVYLRRRQPVRRRTSGI